MQSYETNPILEQMDENRKSRLTINTEDNNTNVSYENQQEPLTKRNSFHAEEEEKVANSGNESLSFDENEVSPDIIKVDGDGSPKIGSNFGKRESQVDPKMLISTDT